MMTVTRDVQETIQGRIQTDAEFATALLDEAISLFLNDESEVARLVLRDLGKPRRSYGTHFINEPKSLL